MRLWDLFRKHKENKNSDEVPYRVSERSLLFIRDYAIPALGIAGRIGPEEAERIMDFAVSCELNMVNEEGNDRTEDYPEKEQDILGDAFVTETSAVRIDLEDLNRRLGR